MAALSQTSRETARDVGAYLTIHRKLATGLVSLRWRERGGDKRHLVAEQVRAMAAERGEAVWQWVEAAAERAEALNGAHAHARGVMQVLRLEQTKQSAMPLYPRAIT